MSLYRSTYDDARFPVPALSLEIIFQTAFTNSFSIITCITLKTRFQSNVVKTVTLQCMLKKNNYLLTSKTKSCAFFIMSQYTR